MLRVVACPVDLVAALFCAALVFAPSLGRAQTSQTAAPSQVTPQNLRPETTPHDSGVVISQPSAAGAPAGSENLDVEIGEVQFEGGFAELAGAVNANLRAINGRRLTVEQIYAFASQVEKLYAQAGYVLARVIVPPQNLIDGGAVKMTVVDGFLEEIDVTAVPARAREQVKRRTAYLVNRHHLRLPEIERCLLNAGDMPGLKLRSTLKRGTNHGGVKLVLEGEHDLITGSVGADNRLPQVLGTWQLRGSVAVNSAFGLGEQIYGTAGLGADPRAVLDGTTPLKLYGGGVIVPVGQTGITVNGEYTHSATQTPAAPAVPATLGTFDRYALRLKDPVIWTRSNTLNANVAVEYVSQKVDAPAFNRGLSDDLYAVLRLGPDYSGTLPWGAGIQLGASFSKGLGGRTGAQAALTDVPLSREDASPYFSKITANARLSQPLPKDWRIDVIAYGQLSLGQAMMKSEQFALDGPDALSAFSAGAFAVDQGATVRAELVKPFAKKFDAINAALSPYLFAAYGHGMLVNPTALEQGTVNAGSLGAGARISADDTNQATGRSLSLEMARQYSDVPGAKQGWRGNVNASVTF